MNKHLRFFEDTHKYLVDGEEFPSVSEIIAFGGGGTDYSQIPEHIVKRAGVIGTRTHQVVEGYYERDEDAISGDQSVNEYLVGFRKFADTKVYQHHGAELRMYSAIYRYAGTLDLLGWINDKLAIVDVKTTYSLNMNAVELQTSGYAQLAAETFSETFSETLSRDSLKRYCLWLKKNGTYKLEPCTDQMSWFRFNMYLKLFYAGQKTE